MPPRALRLVIVMGVSGCGKSTMGKKLAAALGADWQFLDADDFHPPANVAKMSAGIPLDDADRAPWLVAIRKRLDAALTGEFGMREAHAGGRVVLACSALKARYRAALISDPTRTMIVWLNGTKELFLKRLSERHGHFMKSSMLESQLAALEPPIASEAAEILTADIAQTPEVIVGRVARAASP